ncbi:MAG: hypothetical protein V4629_01150 [Pseudomonadota bacterium]
MKLTNLRRKFSQVFNQIIKTAKSVEIKRYGYRLKIKLNDKKDKFKYLVKRENVVACSDKELLASFVYSERR